MVAKSKENIRPVSVIRFLEAPEYECFIEWKTFQNREEAKPTVKSVGTFKKAEDNVFEK